MLSRPYLKLSSVVLCDTCYEMCAEMFAITYTKALLMLLGFSTVKNVLLEDGGLAV
jgi:hypothetical protein